MSSLLSKLWLAPGTHGVISGPPSSAKTVLAAHLAWQAALAGERVEMVHRVAATSTSTSRDKTAVCDGADRPIDVLDYLAATTTQASAVEAEARIRHRYVETTWGLTPAPETRWLVVDDCDTAISVPETVALVMTATDGRDTGDASWSVRLRLHSRLGRQAHVTDAHGRTSVYLLAVDEFGRLRARPGVDASPARHQAMLWRPARR